MPLLEIKDLCLDFVSEGVKRQVLDHVSLSLDTGEILGLVGESGCGKSVTALSVARLLASPPAFYTGGEIRLDGHEVLSLDRAGLQAIRGRVVSYVFQEPAASLNPAMRVGRQIKEMLALHRPAMATGQEVVRLLDLVGIPAPDLRRRDYPHQLSGGMQQRVMIAMALASEPKLLVADEPTTALDVTIQAQILDLLSQLQQRLHMSILLITHNLALLSGFAGRLAVMYAGQIVEMAGTELLLRQPMHPYTRALMGAIPKPGRTVERLAAIPGQVPSLGAYPAGCRFHPRCPMAVAACAREAPGLAGFTPGHWVRCPYALPPEVRP